MHTENPVFSFAADFINQTSRSVFLTGKAGTGKTTFLKHIAATCEKHLAIAAPTGVAAINAGGVTLHSLFQLPLGIYLHNYRGQAGDLAVTNRNSLIRNLRLSQAKRDLLRELQLLIIDEVSMVRCDMLDATDTILRTVRRNQKPFGGVQVLFIGDLFQLSPVARTDEWALLQQEYESPFFFHAHVIRESPPLCLELTKVYRQNEQRFIDLLNAVRNNEMSDRDLSLLNTRLNQPIAKGTVTLTTHNQKADAINQSELNNIKEPAFTFAAIIENEFPPNSFPAEEVIRLKKGTRIMFIKNDSGEDRRFFNGKMATVARVDNDEIEVEFDDGSTHLLERETWHNIRYQYNGEKDQVEEEILGSFVQYPIRLAWAITIHKSQGLTFSNAVIDAGSSFAAGQVYVALSRCTSLEGLVLQSPITARQIMTDAHVVTYSRQLSRENLLPEILEREKIQYQQEKLLRLFDFNSIREALQFWAAEVPERKLPNPDSAIQLSRELLTKADSLLDLAIKTQQWMERNFSKAETSEEEILKAGLRKAVAHFNTLLHDDFFTPIQQHLLSLKSKSKVKKYRGEVLELGRSIAGRAKRLRVASWKDECLFIEDRERPFVEIEASTSGSSGNTAAETWEMFREGLSIELIAERRGLAETTIEGHLARYVKSGELEISRFVSSERIDEIKAVFDELQVTALSPVKQKLGDDYSYTEIRMVFNYLEYLKSNS